MKKKSSRRPFLAHSGTGQETTFYLRVAQAELHSYIFFQEALEQIDHMLTDQQEALTAKIKELDNVAPGDKQVGKDGAQSTPTKTVHHPDENGKTK